MSLHITEMELKERGYLVFDRWRAASRGERRSAQKVCDRNSFWKLKLKRYLPIIDKEMLENLRQEESIYDSTFATGTTATDLQRVRRLQNGSDQKHHDRQGEKSKRAATCSQLLYLWALLSAGWHTAFQHNGRNANAGTMRNWGNREGNWRRNLETPKHEIYSP